MIIRTFKELEDSLYKVKIHTEDFRQNDTDLMANYGEPEINIGGYYEAGPAVAALLDVTLLANPAATGFVAGKSSVEFNANPTEDDIVTIGDGTNTVIFEFGTGLTSGDVLVDNSVDAATTLGNLETAIGSSALTVTTAINTGVLTSTHTDDGTDVSTTTSNAVDIAVIVTAHVAPTNATVNISDGTNSEIFEIKRSTEPLANLNAIAVDNDTDTATTLIALKAAIDGSTVTSSNVIDGVILTLTHEATDANFVATTVDGDVSLVLTSFVAPTEPTFTLPDNLRLLKSDSPFVASFDEKDDADAEDRANLWHTALVAKIKAALGVLRAKADPFTGEESETF